MKGKNLRTAAIVDAYTVEPSGLGVPPYLSGYVRYAFSALNSIPDVANVSYWTIDDYRAATSEPVSLEGYSDPRTYSRTRNTADILAELSTIDILVIVAGDAVPSVHLHAINGSVKEVVEVASLGTRAVKIVLGPMANYFRNPRGAYFGAFDACHSQTFTEQNLLRGSIPPIDYPELESLLSNYEPLIEQLGWEPVAEIELYRGCTRHSYCSFCNEPVKNPQVSHRDPDAVISEVRSLYLAGVRNFRLGQQTCFFSYQGRDVAKIERLLAGIRDVCPDLDVLHVDNVDPLAAASNKGRDISRIVVEYCTEGNAAPMGVESFDRDVIAANTLTCTPEIAMRAIENVHEFGAAVGPRGFPKLLAGLNLIYGLPGETKRTHDENMKWLELILDRGLECHRTNVRSVRTYEGTPLSAVQDRTALEAEMFAKYLNEISLEYDMPMKRRVYPVGRVFKDMHAYFINERGTWFRRLGSYSIQVLDDSADIWSIYETGDVVVNGHEGRNLVGSATRTASA